MEGMPANIAEENSSANIAEKAIQVLLLVVIVCGDIDCCVECGHVRRGVATGGCCLWSL